MNDDQKLAEWLREVEFRSHSVVDDEWRLSFARAIASECARICEEQSKLPECPERATYCADAIRQRFGIEKEPK